MIRPTSTNVLVQPERRKERQTPGGIVLADTTKDEGQVCSAQVVAAGNDTTYRPGTRVLIPLMAGWRCKLDGQDYIMVSGDPEKGEILGTLDPNVSVG